MATKKKSATKKAPAKKAPAKKNNVGPAVAAGAAALTAAAAAGAATYYFYGTKHAKQHRAAATKWAKGLKKDVQSGVKQLKKVDAKAVARVVDSAAKTYLNSDAASSEIRSAAAELKRNWKVIKKELEPSAKVVKTVKKVTKTAKKK